MEHFLECPNYVWWTTTRIADHFLWHLFIFLNVDVLEFVQLMFIPHSKKKKNTLLVSYFEFVNSTMILCIIIKAPLTNLLLKIIFRKKRKRTFKDYLRNLRIKWKNLGFLLKHSKDLFLSEKFTTSWIRSLTFNQFVFIY